jgi:hypothetical protein
MYGSPALKTAGNAALAELETAIRLVAGAPEAPLTGELRANLVSASSTVHGFAHLLLAGQIDLAVGETGSPAVEAMMKGVLARILRAQAGL